MVKAVSRASLKQKKKGSRAAAKRFSTAALFAPLFAGYWGSNQKPGLAPGKSIIIRGLAGLDGLSEKGRLNMVRYVHHSLKIRPG